MNAEASCRLRTVAAAGIQRPADHCFLEPRDRRRQIAGEPIDRWRGTCPWNVGGKIEIARIDDVAAHKNVCALNHVLEFANIPRPAMRQQPCRS